MLLCDGMQKKGWAQFLEVRIREYKPLINRRREAVKCNERMEYKRLKAINDAIGYIV